MAYDFDSPTSTDYTGCSSRSLCLETQMVTWSRGHLHPRPPQTDRCRHRRVRRGKSLDNDLGGIGQQMRAAIEQLTGKETRVTVLEHLQRGGASSAFDRWLATRFGAAAARLAGQDRCGRMVGLRGQAIVDVPLAEAIQTARGIGIVFS